MEQPGKKPDVTLPALRQDLKLYPGSPRSDGSPSWKIHDPVRNRFFEIGWIEFELLARWQEGRTPKDVVTAVALETALRPTEDELLSLLSFLIEHQLVKPTGAVLTQDLKKRWLAKEKGHAWYTQLLHNYLFFRVPLFKPDRFLEATLPWVRFMFTRHLAIGLAVIALIDFYLVFQRIDEVGHSFSYFFNLEGLIYYGLAATFAKVVHEMGHAYTAKYFGVRIPTMGFAFLVMMPILYTDTSESWKLENSRERLLIASAGIIAEFVLALVATLLWCMVTQAGPLKSMLFLLASTTWITTVVTNVSPFMRFDGYYILSDMLELPNLHVRSSALATNWFRRTFFGLHEPDPEPGLSESLKKKLTAFSVFSFIYRISVFLGIAALVYHQFFKLLGIFLMAIEVIWFAVRPIAGEAKVLWKQRAALHPRVRPLALVLVLMAAGLWFFPIAAEVQAPALAHADQDFALYSPFPALVQAVYVQPEQVVTAGTTLVQLDSPDVSYRQTKSVLEARSFAEELRRAPASRRLTDQVTVLEQRMGQSIAEGNAAIDDMQRLTLTAPFDGVVRDMALDLVPGRWVNTKELMLRVVEPQHFVIDAYVNEGQVEELKTGQSVMYYPEATNLPVVKGKVQSIDTTASRTVPHRLLASIYGGAIPTSKDEHGVLVAEQAVYRVRIVPEQTQAHFDTIGRGMVRIDTGAVLVVQNFFSRAAAVFIKESGF